MKKYIIEVKPQEKIKAYKDKGIVAVFANFTEQPVQFDVTEFTDKSYHFVSRSDMHIQIFCSSFELSPIRDSVPDSKPESE